MADETKTPITDAEVESVQGGYGGWEQYAKGTFVNMGNYILYKIAPGDALSGIALRFGVSVGQIQAWNNIQNPDFIRVGQKLTIYPTYIR